MRDGSQSKPMDNGQNGKQLRITFSDIELARQLFGEHNGNLKRISDALEVSIHARGSTVAIQGDEIATALAHNLLEQLYGLLKESYPIYPNDVEYAIRLLSEDDSARLKDFVAHNACRQLVPDNAVIADTAFITVLPRARCRNDRP